MASAASRSAVPVAGVSSASTISPLPVLHQQVAHVAELRFLAAAPADQRGIGIGGRGVGRVGAPLAVEVALGVAPPPPPAGGSSSASSFGLKLFMLAQASISVPSTVKCSSDSSALTSRLAEHRLEELWRRCRPRAAGRDSW